MLNIKESIILVSLSSYKLDKERKLKQAVLDKATRLRVIEEEAMELQQLAHALLYDYYKAMTALEAVNANINIVDVIYPQEEFDFDK